MNPFDVLIEGQGNTEPNPFDVLVEEQQGPNPFDALVEEKEAGPNLIEAAQSGLKLVWKLNQEAIQKTMDMYGSARGAAFKGISAASKNAAAGLPTLTTGLSPNPVIPTPTGQQENVMGAIGQGWAEKTPVTELTEAISNGFHEVSQAKELNRALNTAVQSFTPIGHTGLVSAIPEDRGLLDPAAKAAEVALDVLLDPVLSAMNPAMTALKGADKILGLTKGLKQAVQKAAKAIDPRILDTAERLLTSRGARPAEYVNLMDTFHMQSQKAGELSQKIGDSLKQGLDAHNRAILGDTIRSGDKLVASKTPEEIAEFMKNPLGQKDLMGKIEETAENIGKATDLKEKATYVNDLMNVIGKELVTEKLLTQEQFLKYAGDYMPMLYTEKELRALAGKTGFNFKKVPKIKGDRFRKRTIQSWEEAAKKGVMLDPVYPVARYVQQTMTDLNTHLLYKSIGSNPEWVSDVAKEGYSLLGNIGARTVKGGSNFGVLNGKYLRDDLMMDLQTVGHIPSAVEKMYLKGLNAWKLLKILPNAGSHLNNFFGNLIMADLSKSATWGSVWSKVARSIDEIGSGGQYLQELKANGAWFKDFLSADREFLVNELKEVRNFKTKDIADSLFHIKDSVWNKLKTGAKAEAEKTLQFLSEMYTGEDNAFKMLHYIHARESLGMAVPEAIQYMFKWGFNYADVSPAVRFLRNSPLGSPFITYATKALPRVAEVIANDPVRFFKYPLLIEAVSRMSARVHGWDESDLQRWHSSGNGYRVLLPSLDSEGNPTEMDLAYKLPWGEMSQSVGSIGPIGHVALSNPVSALTMQLIMNKNLMWDGSFYDEREPKLDKAFRTIYQTLMPAMIPGGMAAEPLRKSLSPTPEHRRTKTGDPIDFDRAAIRYLTGLNLKSANLAKIKLRSLKDFDHLTAVKDKVVNQIIRDMSISPDEKRAEVSKVYERYKDQVDAWKRKQGISNE